MHDARPTVADLRDLIRSPGPNNDLIELTAKQPRLAELTASVFPRAIRTLDRSDPVISYARPYIPDLSGWLTEFGQVAAYYDANGHYARVQPVFGPTALDSDQYKLVGVSPIRSPEPVRQGQPHRLPGRVHAAHARRLVALGRERL